MNTKDIEEITGPVDWHDSQCGYLPCPGEHLHTHKSGPRDCRIYLDGVPTLYCVHQSCEAVVAETNANLRGALSAAGFEMPELDDETRLRRTRMRDDLTSLSAARNYVFTKYRWSVDEIRDSNPSKVKGFAMFLGLMFRPEETIWCGNPHETGYRYQNHFQLRDKWATAFADANPFICPNPITPGRWDRRVDALACQRYFVVECDRAHEDPDINRERCGAVFAYLRRVQGMTLRAVVDSGNKSLHGWFEYPGPDKHRWCRTVLPVLGADPATMRLSQPVRRPGALRDNGNPQRLLWLAEGER